MIYSFPVSIHTLSSIQNLYQKTSTIIYSLIGVTLLLKTVYYLLTFKSSTEFIDIFKNALICVLLIYTLPELLYFIFDLSGTISDQFLSANLVKNHNVVLNEKDLPKGMEYFTALGFGRVLTEVLFFILFTLFKYIYSFLLSFVFTFSPIIIYLATSFQIGIGINGLFSLIILLSLWPVAWNLTGYLFLTLLTADENFIIISVYSLLAIIIQIMSPKLFIKLIQNGSTQSGIGTGLKMLFYKWKYIPKPKLKIIRK